MVSKTLSFYEFAVVDVVDCCQISFQRNAPYTTAAVPWESRTCSGKLHSTSDHHLFWIPICLWESFMKPLALLILQQSFYSREMPNCSTAFAFSPPYYQINSFRMYMFQSPLPALFQLQAEVSATHSRLV